MRIGKLVVGLVMIVMILGLTACGSSKKESKNVSGADIPKNKDIALDSGKKEVEVVDGDFVWLGNTIVGLSEEGMKKETIVIPKKCDGFADPDRYGSVVFKKAKYAATSVSFESDKDIALNGVFKNAENLVNITLPKDLTTIGDCDFSGCISLKTITIPEGVLEIGRSAFSGDSGLISVSIPKKITVIRGGTFEGCTALEDVTMPDTVTKIDEYAFNDCWKLTKLTFPSGLIEIGKHAFRNTEIVDYYFPKDLELLYFDIKDLLTSMETITIHTVPGSWADIRFEETFKAFINFEKSYN